MVSLSFSCLVFEELVLKQKILFLAIFLWPLNYLRQAVVTINYTGISNKNSRNEELHFKYKLSSKFLFKWLSLYLNTKEIMYIDCNIKGAPDFQLDSLKQLSFVKEGYNKSILIAIACMVFPSNTVTPILDTQWSKEFKSLWLLFHKPTYKEEKCIDCGLNYVVS